MNIEKSKLQLTDQDNQDSENSFSRVAFTTYRRVVNSSGNGSAASVMKVKFLFLILLFVSGSSFMMANAAMLKGGFSNVGNEHSSKGISNLHSGLTFDFSRALERLHFGPLLRVRSVSNRTPKFASELATTNPREKKALSYLSRFYHPVLQPSHSPGAYNSIHGGSLGSSRRRIFYTQQHHSGETVTFPVGRPSRPVMRLRWGK